jgi:hypothetical protein
MRIRRIHLLVEGQTEETVVLDLFQPYLEANGWSVSRSILLTNRPAAAPAHRGGVSTWSKLEAEIRKLLYDSSLDVVTTLLDYYGFPAGAPGMADRPAGDAVARVEHVERSLALAVGDRRFVPHLTLHETEAWVFAAAEQLAELLDTAALGRKLRAESAAAGGPEMVNDGPSTAPSKRLRLHCPGYTKPVDGPLAIGELGLGELRRQCPHLDAWLTRLETFTP